MDNKSKALAVVCGAAAAMAPALAFANEGETGPTTSKMDALVTSLTSGFTTIANDMLDGIGKIAPVALPVLGGVALVGIGIKVFKKVAGR